MSNIKILDKIVFTRKIQLEHLFKMVQNNVLLTHPNGYASLNKEKYQDNLDSFYMFIEKDIINIINNKEKDKIETINKIDGVDLFYKVKEIQESPINENEDVGYLVSFTMHLGDEVSRDISFLLVNKDDISYIVELGTLDTDLSWEMINMLTPSDTVKVGIDEFFFYYMKNALMLLLGKKTRDEKNITSGYEQAKILNLEDEHTIIVKRDTQGGNVFTINDVKKVLSNYKGFNFEKIINHSELDIAKLNYILQMHSQELSDDMLINFFNKYTDSIEDVMYAMNNTEFYFNQHINDIPAFNIIKQMPFHLHEQFMFIYNTKYTMAEMNFYGLILFMRDLKEDDKELYSVFKSIIGLNDTLKLIGEDNNQYVLSKNKLNRHVKLYDFTSYTSKDYKDAKDNLINGRMQFERAFDNKKKVIRPLNYFKVF